MTAKNRPSDSPFFSVTSAAEPSAAAKAGKQPRTTLMASKVMQRVVQASGGAAEVGDAARRYESLNPMPPLTNKQQGSTNFSSQPIRDAHQISLWRDKHKSPEKLWLGGATQAHSTKWQPTGDGVFTGTILGKARGDSMRQQPSLERPWKDFLDFSRQQGLSYQQQRVVLGLEPTTDSRNEIRDMWYALGERHKNPLKQWSEIRSFSSQMGHGLGIALRLFRHFNAVQKDKAHSVVDNHLVITNIAATKKHAGLNGVSEYTLGEINTAALYGDTRSSFKLPAQIDVGLVQAISNLQREMQRHNHAANGKPRDWNRLMHRASTTAPLGRPLSLGEIIGHGLEPDQMKPRSLVDILLEANSRQTKLEVLEAITTTLANRAPRGTAVIPTAEPEKPGMMAQVFELPVRLAKAAFG